LRGTLCLWRLALPRRLIYPCPTGQKGIGLAAGIHHRNIGFHRLSPGAADAATGLAGDRV